MLRRLFLLLAVVSVTLGVFGLAVPLASAGGSAVFPSPFHLTLRTAKARLALFDPNVRFAPYESEDDLNLTEGVGLGGNATYLIGSEGSKGSAPVQIIAATISVTTGDATDAGNVTAEIASLAGSKGTRWLGVEARHVRQTGAALDVKATFGAVMLRLKVTTGSSPTVELIAESAILFG